MPENFLKAYRTLTRYPGLLGYALVITVFIMILSLPTILHQGGFFEGFSILNPSDILSELQTFVFVESPPVGVPAVDMTGAQGAMNNNVLNTPGGLEGLLLILLWVTLSAFFALAYLGIVRRAICDDKTPDLDDFFFYGKTYLGKLILFFILLSVFVFLASFLIGFVGFLFVDILGDIGEGITEILTHVFIIILSYYILFVEMEIVERESDEGLTESFLAATNMVGENKQTVISHLVGFLVVGVLTLAVSMLLNLLPLAIALVLVPLVNAAVMSYLLITLYYVYYDVSGEIG